MLLAAICVVLGIGSPVIAPVLGDVAQSVLAGSAVTATSGVSLVNEISGAATSTPRDRHRARGPHRPRVRVEVLPRRQGPR